MDRSSRTLRGGIAWTVALAFALSLGAIATASAKDRNHDRIPDRWERQHNLSLSVDQAKRDQDRDELNNRGEYRAGTDPRDDDSDSDGVEDGDEGAGTISAWDPETGELTINLFGGDTVTGTVIEETRIQCASDESDGPTEEPETKHPGEQEGPPPGGPRGEGPGCDEEAPCTADDLAVDGVIQEAHLSATADGLAYDEIRLG